MEMEIQHYTQEHLSFKRLGRKIKKAGKDVGKALDKAKDKLRDAGEDILYAPLLPFKNAMEKRLKSEGFSVPKGIGDVSQAFYHHIIKGESYDESFDPVSVTVVVQAILKLFDQVDQLVKKGKGTAKEIGMIKTAEKDLEKEIPSDEKPPKKRTRDESDDNDPDSEKKEISTGLIIAAVIALIVIMKG